MSYAPALPPTLEDENDDTLRLPAAEVRLNGILPRAFAEAMLPKAQAPSRVGLGQPLLLGKFGRRRHRLGLLALRPNRI